MKSIITANLESNANGEAFLWPKLLRSVQEDLGVEKPNNQHSPKHGPEQIHQPTADGAEDSDYRLTREID
jgi:hypothetical protein